MDHLVPLDQVPLGQVPLVKVPLTPNQKKLHSNEKKNVDSLRDLMQCFPNDGSDFIFQKRH